jgi:hypothetical protein
MSKPRIPYTISTFNDYIVNTDDQLQATNTDTGNQYYKDYNISDADSKEWSNRRVNWVKNIYPAYINPATSTSIVKANVKTFIKDFHTFGNPLLNKIAASDVAGNTEEHIFNLVLHKSNPSHATAPITAQCSAAIHSAGTGMYEISCKGSYHEGRSRKVDGADSVQFSYAINAQQPATVPAPDAAGMIKDISTTAIFTQDFGSDNLGKWLTIYFRWYNTKHPQLAGAWSAVQVVAIG